MTAATSSSLIDLVTHDWKQINLPSLRNELDEQLLNFDKLSTDNKTQRKELSKATKDLKKCKKEEKYKKFGSVLKLYQKHIDSKDNECKYIFESFLKIYKILSEAPDPIDALQNGQIEILKLQKDLLDYDDIKIKLSNYETEFKALKNQEITVKKLREEIKNIELQKQKDINIELINQEQQLKELFNNELNEKDIKYNECKLQYQTLQNEIIELQQKFDEQQNNLLSKSLDNETDNNIREQTQNMLEEELERANIKILTLEKERDQLLNDKNNNKNNNNVMTNTEMLKFEIDTLKKRLNECKESNNTLQSNINNKISEYNKLKQMSDNNINKLQQNIEKYKNKLSNLPSVDEYKLLKEKVTILQYQFLNSNNMSNNISSPIGIMNAPINIIDQNDVGNSLPINANIDTVFNTKLQSLQSELTTLKLDLHSKNIQLTSLQKDYENIKQQCTQQKLLIIKLENDLTDKLKGGMNIKKINEKENDKNDKENDTDSLFKILGNDEEKKVKELTINMSDKNETETETENENENEQSKDNSAFLVVCEQRDRFRNKLQELEQTKIRIESKLDKLSADNQQLKQENVDLYTKIKFVEDYSNVKKTQNNQLTNRIMKKGREEIDMKYEGLYEESMNPFAQFRKREKDMRINSLDWTEWIAFMVGSTVLSKRTFRLFGVFYAIALHLLIFFTILHEYRSHGVFEGIHDCGEQLPALQIDIPAEHIMDGDIMIPNDQPM